MSGYTKPKKHWSQSTALRINLTWFIALVIVLFVNAQMPFLSASLTARIEGGLWLLIVLSVHRYFGGMERLTIRRNK